MTELESIKIDLKIVRDQLESFEQFLNEKQEITETEISKFFKNNKYEKMFKGKEIDFFAYLIIGRTSFIEDEKQRFEWRRNKIEINAQKVTYLTFDDLLIALKRKTEWINMMEQKT